jgi:hypothetical protein
MLSPFTPHSSSFDLVPSSNGSMMAAFHRAWTMPMRRPEPSCMTGAGPLFRLGAIFNVFLMCCEPKRRLEQDENLLSRCCQWLSHAHVACPHR